MSWREIGALAGMLFAVAAVLLLAWLSTRFLAGRGLLGGGRRAAGPGSENLRIVERIPLGRDEYLAVARVGRRYLLLGVTPSQITLLRELDEAEAWTAPETAPAPPRQSGARFQDTIQEAWKNRKNK